jgi:hypothetical protein
MTEPMRWPHDSEGTPVEEPDAFDAIVAGLEMPVRALTPELRATYLSVEAIAQAAAMLGASDDLAHQLRDIYPVVVPVLKHGPTNWMVGTGLETVSDIVLVLQTWDDGMAFDLARVLGEWCYGHYLPDPIRLWIKLPGIGFTLLSVQHGGIQMNVPSAAVHPDKE